MKLGTTYLGFDLPNPLAPGASPMCDRVDFARRLEDCGAPMLTLRSLFQEQISQEPQYAESLAYFDEQVEFRMGPDTYLAQVSKLKSAVGIPVVASLNCHTSGRWIDYAGLIQQAGADALELNILNPVVRFDHSSQQVEQETVAVVTAVRAATKLPLAVKLMPNYAALPHFARQLVQAGAQALVLFNRLYQPEIDLEDLGLHEELRLSSRQELSPRLRAVSALAGRLRCDLAITGGAHTASDVIRATLAGANVVQMVSALLQNGPDHLRRVCGDVERWLDMHDFDSLSQVRGSMSLFRTPRSKADFRKNFMSILNKSPEPEPALEENAV
jgi:dihydroorotate dehydrogenase (fumarate)